MKKIILILVLVAIAAGVLSFYIYSYARQKANLPKPEDMAGREASAFLPEKIEDKTSPPGSRELKVTGPVWVEE